MLLALLIACGDPKEEAARPDRDGDGVPDVLDCAPEDPAVHPGATDGCDHQDDDCDGVEDEDGPFEPRWADEDLDGWGDDARPVATCWPGATTATQPGDCAPHDPDAHPGADERCDHQDDDCDGRVDEDAVDRADWFPDGDGDGFGVDGAAHPACEDPGEAWADRGGDCDDADAAVFPGAAERCTPHGVDEDCDGVVDEAGAEGERDWYLDADGDGFGGEVGGHACAPAADEVANALDCDDGDPWNAPGNPERCDGRDEDCDGVVDEGAVDATLWYLDADGDGFGDPGSAVPGCGEAGRVLRGDDCDDGDPAVHPAAVEDCAVALDLNCDGLVGEGDADGDGFPACDECDDGDARVHPGARETCDGVDQDCDGGVDDGAPGAVDHHPDLDRDGWGDAAVTRTSCAPVPAWTEVGEDCDDADAAVHPGAREACRDGLDSDCDGTENDEGARGCAWWATDLDGDGALGEDTLRCFCEATGAWQGREADADDCDDHVAGTHPGAEDAACDGVDVDCDLADCDAHVSARIGPLDSAAPTVFVSGDRAGALWVSDYYREVDGAFVGQVDLFPGDADAGLDAAVASITADEDGAAFGASMAVRDVDGDGDDDLLIGAPYASAYRAEGGSTWFVPGPVEGVVAVEDAAAARWDGHARDARAGYPHLTDDLTDDGVVDGWIVLPYSDTAAPAAGEVVHADLGWTGDFLTSDAEVRILGATEGDGLGARVVGPGDLDGDGVDELVLTGIEHSGAEAAVGAVWILSGPLSGVVSAGDAGTIWEGAHADAGLGSEASVAGDVDGDGRVDLWVAESSRALYLFTAPADGVGGTSDDAALTVLVEQDGAFPGAVVGGLDVDGSGRPDLAVADPAARSGGEDTGLVHLFLDPPAAGLLLGSDHALAGPGATDEIGRSLWRLPGFGADGLDALAAGTNPGDLLILDLAIP